jgi:ATP-binding cassette subfamily B protein/subfamily B ATP-binding cassette protein MsbA
LRELAALAAPKRTLILASLACVAAASVLKLVPPLATGFIFDTVLGGHKLPPVVAAILGPHPSPPHLLALVAIGMALAALLAVAFVTAGRYFSQVAVKSSEARLRRRLYQHALRLPLESIYRTRIGGVASLLRNDVQMSASLLTSVLFTPWGSIVQLGGTLVVLAFVNARMLLAPLLLVPLLFWAHRAWVDRVRPLWRTVHAIRARVDADATEALGGIRIVRGFGREATEARRMSVGQHRAIRQEFRAWWGAVAVDVAWAFLIPTGVAVLLWYGASQVIADPPRLTQGELVMILFYVALLLEPMAAIARSGTEAQNGLACLDRVLTVLESPIERPRGAGRRMLDPGRIRGELTLSGVGYHYPGGALPVLHDVNLRIEPAEMVALVGRSGAGKSTLCDVIARFVEPSSGRVLLDGIDLREVDVRSYRRLLAIVEQDVTLFDGTIAENIASARPGASAGAIRRAADAAHVSEFTLRLADGLDTRVGERGVAVSGGQRQRIAIARAILADPRILILDEATSDLDSESQRLVQASLRSLMHGRTVICIAHRPSTILEADRVVMLEHGRIVDSGRPADLLAHSPRFRMLVQS